MEGLSGDVARGEETVREPIVFFENLLKKFSQRSGAESRGSPINRRKILRKMPHMEGPVLWKRQKRTSRTGAPERPGCRPKGRGRKNCGGENDRKVVCVGVWATGPSVKGTIGEGPSAPRAGL